jgi:hypothetical protein
MKKKCNNSVGARGKKKRQGETQFVTKIDSFVIFTTP